MKRTTVSVIVLTLVLIGTLTLAFNVQPVRAEGGTIYIRADGNVEPTTAPISTIDNITYTFTDSIYDSIIVERNNIAIDGNGYTVQGPGAANSRGIDLTGRTNVTVRNTQITGWYFGIYDDSSSSNTMVGNTITSNEYAIELTYFSNYNHIIGNDITNNQYGIDVYYSSYNSIIGNAITANYGGTIVFWRHCDYNSVIGNSIRNNGLGIYLIDDSTFNNITGNNITDNTGAIYLSHHCYYNSISENNIANNILGIAFYTSRFNSISGNRITANQVGIDLSSSGYNSIIGNTIAANNVQGIDIFWCSHIDIVTNNITDNGAGVSLYGGHYNSITGNNIMDNADGIRLDDSSNNTIFHNNFIGNERQVFDVSWSYPSRIPSNITWDNGYPSGGNYWSDYTTRYPSAHELSRSRIWDTPYVIDENNKDNYPLIEPWTPPIIANVDIDPDTLNLGSKGKWITVYLQLPEGYNIADIDASTILLNGTVAPILDPKIGFVRESSEYLVDYNNDGIVERMVKFDWSAVGLFIVSRVSHGNAAMTITGRLLDGTRFEGTDTIKITAPVKG